MFVLVDVTGTIGFMTDDWEKAVYQREFCLSHRFFPVCEIYWID